MNQAKGEWNHIQDEDSDITLARITHIAKAVQEKAMGGKTFQFDPGTVAGNRRDGLLAGPDAYLFVALCVTATVGYEMDNSVTGEDTWDDWYLEWQTTAKNKILTGVFDDALTKFQRAGL